MGAYFKFSERGTSFRTEVVAGLAAVLGGSIPIPDPAGGSQSLFVSPVTAPA